MEDNALLEWVTLQLIPGIGHRAQQSLLQRWPDPKELLQLSSNQLRESGVPGRIASLLLKAEGYREAAERSLNWISSVDGFVLTRDHPDYPPLLKEISDPPMLLYGLGDPSLLSRPQLAVVGSRHPTKAGENCARHFARELAAAGMTITSGMALGVDGSAHLGALESKGQTVAVLGTGVDVVYPKRHADLYQRIAHQGVVVSEAPLASPPRPEMFPRRNRIISGLSLGVLVVEAALGSGSLITARLAMEQNREVFALPGSIHNPLARGCHSLIREGAILVEEVKHLFEPFAAWIETETPVSRPISSVSKEEKAVLEVLEYEPQPLDYLLAHCPLQTTEIMGLLTELELRGVVENRGGLYQRVLEVN